MTCFSNTAENFNKATRSTCRETFSRHPPPGSPLPLAPPPSVPPLAPHPAPGLTRHLQHSGLRQPWLFLPYRVASLGDCRQTGPGSGSLALALINPPSSYGHESRAQTLSFGPGRLCMPAALTLAKPKTCEKPSQESTWQEVPGFQPLLTCLRRMTSTSEALGTPFTRTTRLAPSSSRRTQPDANSEQSPPHSWRTTS